MWRRFDGESFVWALSAWRWNLQVRVGKELKIVNAGFATKVDNGSNCTSLISYVLDLHTSEMKNDGFYDRTWRQYLWNHGERVCLDERGTASFVEESEPAHGGTCCVAVLIALVVHIQKRRTSERSSATDLVAGNNERAMKNKSSGIWTSQSYIVSKRDFCDQSESLNSSIWAPPSPRPMPTSRLSFTPSQKVQFYNAVQFQAHDEKSSS